VDPPKGQRYKLLISNVDRLRTRNKRMQGTGRSLQLGDHPTTGCRNPWNDGLSINPVTGGLRRLTLLQLWLL
jgi:hypothetical protein